jgi:hypothetical protein
MPSSSYPGMSANSFSGKCAKGLAMSGILTQNETTGTGGLEEEAISLTGSQMFRDAASRLMETGFGKEYRQDIFEAFCLWPHRVGDAEFRPGPLIANQLHLSPNVDGAIRGRYQTLIEMGALQLLAHELSHCLFPSRDTLVAWHGSDEMVAIRSDLADRCAAQRTAHNGWSDPDFEDLLKPECEQSPRTRRAISEAFFDLRALEMIILAEGEYADPDFEEVFLGTLVRLTSNNIAIMIMRDAMTEAMHSRKAMYETMIQAIHETLQRCYVIHTALAARFRSRYPGFNTFRLEQMLNENRESIKLFASFYMADLCNNLPSLAFEGEDWQEYEERAWTEFMSVVKSSALP